VLATMHALAEAGHPYQAKLQVRVGDKAAMLEIHTHLDALNAHITAVAASLTDDQTFKEIKLRICTDLTAWNSLLPDVPFASPLVADAVALLGDGAYMAKGDAKNMF